MKKVYTELLEGHPYIPFLYPNLGIEERESILFLQRAFRYMDLKKPFVEMVKDPTQADYILLPHNYSSLKGQEEYIQRLAQLAQAYDKKLLIFWHGDSDAPVEIPNSIIFRTSQYRSTKRANEIMMPAYAEDLLESTEIIPRHKGALPVVGFCGWANYKNLKNRIGTLLKNALWSMRAFLKSDLMLLAYKKGITYRMQALKVFQKSTSVKSNFIIRNSYSGHKSTISLDPSQARLEYRGNMLMSDFALVVKGDGNYSYRFYEALSLGRVPLLIDTECVFPLEDVLDYSSFTIRIPFTELSQADRILKERFLRMSDQEFVAMQQKARDVFAQYLRIDMFLRYAVEQLL